MKESVCSHKNTHCLLSLNVEYYIKLKQFNHENQKVNKKKEEKNILSL